MKITALFKAVAIIFELAVSAGLVPGVTGVNKFGRNSNVDSNTKEEIWDGSAAYVFPATALMTSISQTTDQAAMRGQVVEIQGLDANWDLKVQEATLDASDTTTVVTLGTALIRVFRMKVLADVVTDQDIRVHNAGETQDYAIITAGNNQALMAIYTVPNGKTAYMCNLYGSISPETNKDPTKMQFELWASDRDNSCAAQIKHTVGFITGTYEKNFCPYQKFTQKTDIFITSTPTGKAADVSAGFDLYLVDN